MLDNFKCKLTHVILYIRNKNWIKLKNKIKKIY
jgi:hypothetical protein